MDWSVSAPGHASVRSGPRRRTLRYGIIALAVAAMLCAYVVVVVTRANAAETLLSQGKPTTASSAESAATPASSATDGNAGTRWSSAFTVPQWIQVDLGSQQSITRVALNWEAAYATAFTIQTSNDAANWTQIYSTTTGTGGSDVSLAVTGSGRYVRLNATAKSTQYGISLWELQIFGGSPSTPGSCGATNAALNKPALASSTENAGTPAASAFDGNTGTRWSSAASDPQWLRVDLGSVQAVCGVTLNWEAAYATAFQIQTSNDGNTWTSIYTTTTGTGGVQNLNVTGSGRYVRVNGTARATQYGYSLWEFQVRVTGAPSTTNDTPTSPSTSPTPSTNPGNAVLLSYKKPAVASTSQNDTNCNPCTPDKAFDNDPASRWATSPDNGWVDPGWIYVDLGATAHITQVVLQWDPAYAVSYQIQTSTDAVNWTSIYTTTTGKGFKETLTVNGNGRYVRMYGTQRSNGYGYSLWEFKVYGTGGAPTQPPVPPADPIFPATNLVWQDEFNTGTNVDTTKWHVDPGTGQNGEIQYYSNLNNTSIQGGSLVIEARKETAGGRDYTSGRINTSTSFTTQYGRVEARIKVPKGNGLWPAFWMMGADFLQGRPWPYNGEIDIMEILGKSTTDVYSTLHAPAYNGGGGYGQKLTTVDLSLDYHVYSVEWDSKHMTFRVDNTVILVANKDTVETTRGPWVYDHQFYLILNLAVGGDFPGPIDATTPFPARMYVDYVRVYK
ncbi:discoidin domain-containing protein [Dactylosporangium vinaceum]|uniref:Discoidin domain-containing protein n=1 Tax=Dactylosporangium vinaceum TaxID=53362 RepID=A0ABV5M8B5_9ACTN|nr:discoidin domain-containing protein [Dactylosporangium vinaceum]